ncbi:MAG: spermidine synthase [Saprospiraceae bacterium]
MDIPRWKKWLSYLFEFHVESTSSEHNPHLYVSIKNGRYQLSTANAIYSYGDLYDNFSGAFEKMDLDKAAFKNVLVLGLGLGSIPIILEKVFKKQYTYTAVEIDEEVVYLASKYTLPELSSRIDIVSTDASLYLLQCIQKFDLIAVDIFLDDVIPAHFQQSAFLEQLKPILTEKGVILYNHLAYTATDRKKGKAFFEKTFKAVFPEGTYVETNGNWMMMSSGEWLR